MCHLVCEYLSSIQMSCTCLTLHYVQIIPDTTDLGCQLEPRVAPTTLCSSINALLNEMASGVDPNNKRVLDSLEETLGGSLDTEEVDINGDNKCNGGKTSILLRRMLLPLYRIRSEMMQSQMSQMSQSPSRDISGIKTESYSLIQVLLRIDILQPRLLSSLIQLLPEIASRFQSEDSSLTEDIPKLIFANIRWLDHIIDSASLTAAFSECLTILASSSADCPKTKGILLDAIATLPDVLNDYNTFGGDDGDSVLATLQLLRVEDPTLLIPCLDAIDSLPLGEIEVEKVMNDALEALANVEAWGLPALTTFLINNCPRGGGMAKQVIEEFRKLPLGGGDDDDYLRDDAQSASDTEALMIEALSRGFAHRSDLTSTLLKSIKETAQGYHKPADIWLLACCASATHNRAQVKTVFRLKANDGGFTSQMVRQSLEGNGVALTSLFGTSLCDLADSLLRSTDGETCELGVTLYDVLFSEFKEPMQRQEVVGSLATHVGAGVGSRQSEVDAAMRAFSSIISQNQSKDKESGVCALRPFTPFLTSLLDHLPNMSTFQVRKLFVLLFTVGAEGEEGTGGGLCGEAGILIKKYIGLNDFTKKQIVSVST
jgi:Fanconi anemia group D2 protein